MARRKSAMGWSSIVTRGLQAVSRAAVKAARQAANKAAGKAAREITRQAKKATRATLGAAARRAVKSIVEPVVEPVARRASPSPDARPARPGAAVDWIPGIALAAGGARRYCLYKPPGTAVGERLPMMVMLHGCGQDAAGFAASTRMNAIAARERFLVLYPEQDRLANAQGCWNWFATRSGRARSEVALILAAIDQVGVLHGVDLGRVSLCGLSAGASMAALVALAHPDRFRAVVMHSGVPPGAARSTVTALAAMRGMRAPKPLAVTPSLPDATGVRLPPLLVIHGTADRVVAPANARATALVWAHAGDVDHHGPLREDAERRVQRGQRYPVRIVDFKRRAQTVAVHVEVEGLGHAWSGGAAGQAFTDGRGPDASRMAWAFTAKNFQAS